MRLKNYKILSINNIQPVSPPILMGSSGKVYEAEKPTAIITYDLPFVYNEFKMICLMAIFRFEGVSFRRTTSQALNYEFCECYKGKMIDYKIIPAKAFRGGDGHIRHNEKELPTMIEMTIMITRTELMKVSKFTAVPT